MLLDEALLTECDGMTMARIRYQSAHTYLVSAFVAGFVFLI
jgi:hypothetical protein